MWEGEAGETRLAQVGDLKEDPWIVGVNEVPFGGREGLSLTTAIPGTFATDLEDAMSEVRGRIYQALVAYGFRVAHSGDQECDVELPRAPWVTRNQCDAAHTPIGRNFQLPASNLHQCQRVMLTRSHPEQSDRRLTPSTVSNPTHKQVKALVCISQRGPVTFVEHEVGPVRLLRGFVMKLSRPTGGSVRTIDLLLFELELTPRDPRNLCSLLWVETIDCSTLPLMDWSWSPADNGSMVDVSAILNELFLLKMVDPRYKDDIRRFTPDACSCTKAGLHDPFPANVEVNSHNLAFAFEI
ncbi:hypothetical protein EDB19DRAFT_1948556 [Suillus lakei]|nr:hypothetical protein EDB19DRAFT_1948556 [Suillus lakei]